MGAKPVAGALMNTPFAKAVKGVGKIGAVGIGLGAKGALVATDAIKDKAFERKVNKEMDKNGEGSAYKKNADGSDAETKEEYEARRAEAEEKVLERKPGYRKNSSEYLESKTSMPSLMAAGEDKLRANVGIAFSELSQTKEGTPEYAKAKDKDGNNKLNAEGKSPYYLSLTIFDFELAENYKEEDKSADDFATINEEGLPF